MHHTQVPLDPLGGRAQLVSPAFVCSASDGDGDAAWIHVGGELDIATAPQLERTLRDPQLQARVVLLDLRQLMFIDSCGVHAIVDASLRARRAGHRLVLLRGAPNVDRMFTLTGSSTSVEIGDADPFEPPGHALMRFAAEAIEA
jgi:anti-anti-sigma factor